MSKDGSESRPPAKPYEKPKVVESVAIKARAVSCAHASNTAPQCMAGPINS